MGQCLVDKDKDQMPGNPFGGHQLKRKFFFLKAVLKAPRMGVGPI
jgi:hypothetical protein